MRRIIRRRSLAWQHKRATNETVAWHERSMAKAAYETGVAAMKANDDNVEKRGIIKSKQRNSSV